MNEPQLYADVVHNMQVGLHLYQLENLDDDRSLRMIVTNPAASLFTGVAMEEVLGKTLDENFPGLREKGIPQLYAEIVRSGRSQELEDVYYSDDRVIQGAFAVMAFALPDNCVGVVFENITKRKQAEQGLAQARAELEQRVEERTRQLAQSNQELQQEIDARHAEETQRRNLEKKLQQAQKLESLGVLAGGIAHDFNNLLMGVLGNAEMALLDLAPESPALPCITDIQTSALRLAELTKQMLAYSGRGKFVVEHINISKMVEEITHLLEVSIPKKVVIKYDLAQDLPAIEADASQVRQVIMNLLTNAAEACQDRSGIVTLHTGFVHADEKYISENYLLDQLPEGYYVYLEVSDTGCGMDEQAQEKIFDPFFSTKFTGRGLGLAAVLGIVRGHGGAIKVYSEPKRGSSFKVLLPASDETATNFVDLRKPDSTFHGQGVVLLVDDEETVRAIGRRMLERMGYTVWTAEDGDVAVQMVQKKADQISVILLDLTMPKMDGVEAFREMRRIRSDLKVILSSGYNQQDATSHFAGKGLAGFIQKPYRYDTLAETLAELLSDPKQN